MKKPIFKTIALLNMVCLAPAYADDATELARLRQENAELKQQLAVVKETKDIKDTRKETTRDFAPMLAPSENQSSWKPEALKDFSISIGTKVWVNRWDTSAAGYGFSSSFPGSNPGSGVAVDSNIHAPVLLHSDEQVTAIPTLNLRYKNFLLGGSYYAQTSFGFDSVESNTRMGIGSNGQLTSDRQFNTIDTYNAKREEWDINVGYAITPNIAFLTGYKSVRQQIDTQRSESTLDFFTGRTTFGDTQSAQSIFDLDGPLLGLALSAPMAHGFGTYFNYMHGFMTEHHSDNAGHGINSAADYNLIEGGLSYSLDGNFIPAGTPISAAAIYAGYRYQWIEVQSGSNSGNKDITQGFAAGLNLAF
ncbi:MAG: hypothetical protein HOP02_16110 [Methylococcaceae bacterium]|nr:hypothetical protein [Methylococcaceae bacterium]